MFLFTHLIMATLTPFWRYRSIRDWLQCTVYVRLPTPEAQLTYLRIHESTRVHLGHMAESRALLYRRPWLSGVIASLAYILQHIERARVLPIFSRYTNYHFTLPRVKGRRQFKFGAHRIPCLNCNFLCHLDVKSVKSEVSWSSNTTYAIIDEWWNDHRTSTKYCPAHECHTLRTFMFTNSKNNVTK